MIKKILANIRRRVTKIRTHKHTCSCGYTWEHSDDMAGNTEAHTCVKCGKVTWWGHG